MARYPLAFMDADVILYQALSPNLIYFGDSGTAVNLKGAKRDFEDIVFDWIQAANANHYVLCLSSSTNFRKNLLPTYKSHRGEKPEGFAELKEWVKLEYDAQVYTDLEADDTIGILMTEKPGNVAVSIDKDFLTIPGDIFNPTKSTLTQVTEDAANLFWLRQGIMGDSVDGYKGIPGAGKVKAAKVLHTVAPLEVLWRVYIDAYETAGLTLEDAVMQARMARILRAGDYDRRSQTVVFGPPIPVERDELPPEYSSDVPASRNPTPPRPSGEGHGSGSGRRQDHGGLNDEL